MSERAPLLPSFLPETSAGVLLHSPVFVCGREHLSFIFLFIFCCLPLVFPAIGWAPPTCSAHERLVGIVSFFGTRLIRFSAFEFSAATAWRYKLQMCAYLKCSAVANAPKNVWLSCTKYCNAPHRCRDVENVLENEQFQVSMYTPGFLWCCVHSVVRLRAATRRTSRGRSVGSKA